MAKPLIAAILGMICYGTPDECRRAKFDSHIEVFPLIVQFKPTKRTLCVGHTTGWIPDGPGSERGPAFEIHQIYFEFSNPIKDSDFDLCVEYDYSNHDRPFCKDFRNDPSLNYCKCKITVVNGERYCSMGD